MSPVAALLVAVAATGSSHTNPVLIVLPPVGAGPEVPPGSYIQDTWVRWPVAVDANGNQLLSLVSGVDWVGDPRDYAFRSSSRGWESTRKEDLERRGYFSAKRDSLGIGTAAIVKGGRFAPSVMLLALERDGITTALPGGTWPANTLMVFGAHDWVEVDEVAYATTGRVAIVEYPPPKDAVATRLWLRGPWPPGRLDLSSTLRPALPKFAESGNLPGLVPARKVGALLVSPTAAQWESDPGRGWGGAGPWLAVMQTSGPILRLAIGLLVAALAAIALRLVADERRSRTVAAALATAITAPLLVVGSSAFYDGNWEAALIWGTPVMALAMAAGMLLLRLFKVSWLQAGGILGSAMLLVSRPELGSFSGPLSAANAPISPEAIACFYGSLTLACTGRGWPRATGWALTGIAIAASILTPTWWAPSHGVLVVLPFVSALAGQGRLRTWMAFPMWIATSGFAAALNVGIAFNRNGLVDSYRSWDALDLANIWSFLLSSTFLLPAFYLMLLVIWTSSFAAYQLRRVWSASPHLNSLLRLASVLAILGIFQPGLLAAGWLLFLLTVCLWLIEAVWLSPALA